MSLPGFFDLDHRLDKFQEKDPLVRLNVFVEWKNFLGTLRKVQEKARKSNAGRKPYDVVLMFKVLM